MSDRTAREVMLDAMAQFVCAQNLPEGDVRLIDTILLALEREGFAVVPVEPTEAILIDEVARRLSEIEDGGPGIFDEIIAKAEQANSKHNTWVKMAAQRRERATLYLSVILPLSTASQEAKDNG